MMIFEWIHFFTSNSKLYFCCCCSMSYRWVFDLYSLHGLVYLSSISLFGKLIIPTVSHYGNSFFIFILALYYRLRLPLFKSYSPTNNYLFFFSNTLSLPSLPSSKSNPINDFLSLWHYITFFLFLFSYIFFSFQHITSSFSSIFLSISFFHFKTTSCFLSFPIILPIIFLHFCSTSRFLLVSSKPNINFPSLLLHMTFSSLFHLSLPVIFFPFSSTSQPLSLPSNFTFFFAYFPVIYFRFTSAYHVSSH